MMLDCLLKASELMTFSLFGPHEQVSRADQFLCCSYPPATAKHDFERVPGHIWFRGHRQILGASTASGLGFGV